MKATCKRSFRLLKKHDVPEDAKCLWDQQEKILKSSSPEGYRWHPKYVTHEVFSLCVFVVVVVVVLFHGT